MADELEELRRSARLEGAEEVRLLIGTLSEAEYDRLGALLEAWRAGGEWPTRAEIRECLEPVGSGTR
jgi:hypothetical protein